jgi:hypothetical protein
MNPEEIVPNSLQAFVGIGYAVVLSTQKALGEDKHIMVNVLIQVDTGWALAKSGKFSAFWLPRLLIPMQEALKWLTENARQDIFNDAFCGWVMP